MLRDIARAKISRIPIVKRHMENITITLMYGVSLKEIYTAKFNFAFTDGESALISQISRTVPGFNLYDFIIVHETLNGPVVMSTPLIINEETFSRRENLRVIRRKVNVIVKRADQDPMSVNISVLDPVISISEQVYDRETGANYAIGFQQSAKLQSLHVCCSWLSLISQGWFFQPLLIMRRISRKDLTLLDDGVFRQVLLKNFKVMTMWNVSYYSTETWMELAALQFISEGRREADCNFIRGNLARCVPQSILKNTELFAENVMAQLYGFKSMTVKDAEIMCIRKAAEGCQAALIFHVRFPWKYTIRVKRVLMVSPKRIIVLREFPLTCEEDVEVKTVESVTSTDADMVMTFKDGTEWTFGIDNGRVLEAVFERTKKVWKWHDEEEEEAEEVHDATETSLASEVYCVRTNEDDQTSEVVIRPHVIQRRRGHRGKGSASVSHKPVMSYEMALRTPGLMERVAADPFTIDSPYSMRTDIKALEILGELNPELLQVPFTDDSSFCSDVFFAPSPGDTPYTSPGMWLLIILTIIWTIKRLCF